jgi:acyl transferase domain-containing protein
MAAGALLLHPAVDEGRTAAGAALYAAIEDVRRGIDEAADVLRPLVGADLSATFRGRPPRVPVPQPTRLHTCLLQSGMLHALRRRGLQIEGALAISLGEWPAAFAAGVLDLEGLFKTVVPVMRVLERMHVPGRMWVVEASAAGAEDLAHRAPGGLHVLGAMEPRKSLVAAADADVNAMRSYLSGRILREQPASVAIHRPWQSQVRDHVDAEIADVPHASTRMPLYLASRVPGGEDSTELSADHWSFLASHPFRFDVAATAALRRRYAVVVVLGSAPSLTDPLAVCAQAHGLPLPEVVSLLVPDDEEAGWAAALGRLQDVGVLSRRRPLGWRRRGRPGRQARPRRGR